MAVRQKTTSATRRNFRTRNKIRSVNLNQVGVRETRPRLSVHRTGRQAPAPPAHPKSLILRARFSPALCRLIQLTP